MTTVLLVEKLGNIKPLKIKEYNEEDFYKKCGYKSSNNFKRQHTWLVKVKGTNYWVSLFAKTDVKNSLGENKYEFPPPVDSVLYFGTCLLVAYTNNPNGMVTSQPVSLSVDLWTEMYNKLYGGFENLADTAESDAKEYDELEHIPSHKKTKEGYLKDGFVVESKPKKVSTSNSSKSKKLTSAAAASSTSSTTTTKKTEQSISDDENENTDDCDEDDESTVYTDIDDEEDDVSTGGGSKKKNDSTSKKKGASKVEVAPTPTIEMTINELLITDELKEEPYIE